MKKLFTLFILLLLLPWAAGAQVSYIECSWNGSEVTSETKSISDYFTIDSDNPPTSWGGSDDQEYWYVANDEITIEGRVTVTGNVHLILADGCELTVNGGIHVSEGNSLTIYAQSTDDNMGKLVAAVEGGCAGIGGDENQNGGIITIHGGAVTATVTKAEGDQISAGIGGYGGGTIIIYGGMVTATSSAGTGIGDNNCTITIYGGTVNATGFGGAGIGGTVTISGGTVNATGNSGAGIGGGSYGAGGSITISGGTVTATGNNGGAGIGGGICGDGGTITISGGTVNATSNGGGAGIGGGGSYYGDTGGASGTFSTGTNGNAFIIASSVQDNDEEKKANWSGVIFEGKNGGVYGNQTLKQDLTINNDETLTIVKDAKLTIPADVTLTNEGTIVNYGTIDGTVTGTVLIGLTEEMIEVEEATYTGKPVTPEVTVEKDGVTYEKDKDYTVEYTNNTNAGETLTVTVTPIGSKLGGAAVKKEFTIAKADATLSFAKETVSATIGETVENTLTIGPEGVAVSYSSSDETVATVDASTGAVTLVGAGETTITATIADENYEVTSADYTLMVTQATLAEGAIAAVGETNISIEMGGAAFELIAQVTADDLGTGGTWTWASNNEAVATVDLKKEDDASGYSLRATTTTVTSTAIVTPHSVGTATITATYADSKYTGTVTYTVTVTKPYVPDPDPDPIRYYNIYVEDVCDGVEVSTSKQVVREGGSINVYVEKDTANYTFDNFKVYYKRSYYGTWETLEEGVQPGEYPIHNIWAHIYVKAEGAEEKEDPTGIESIEGVKVYTKDGSLYVQTPQREQVIIVSMSGAVVKNEEQVGLKQYQGLQPGIYIVRIGETTYKIRL